MKIYRPTEYIQPGDYKVGILKLEVVSQWDFKTTKVCFEVVEGNLIGLTLKRCAEILSESHTKWGYIEKPTKAMEKELVGMGYELATDSTPKPSVDELETKLDELVFRHEGNDRSAWCCLRDASIRKEITELINKEKTLAVEQYLTKLQEEQVEKIEEVLNLGGQFLSHQRFTRYLELVLEELQQSEHSIREDKS